MAWNKPYPNIDADIKPFWDMLRKEQFALHRCKTCGKHYWPAAYCWHEDGAQFFENMEWVPTSGKGTVFSFCIVHWPFHPGFKDELPYASALVEMDEGPMFGSTIVGCDPKDVHVGMRVEVQYSHIEGENFTIPLLRPVRETE